MAKKTNYSFRIRRIILHSIQKKHGWLMLLKGVDYYLRYTCVSRSILGRRVLDVGAGGKSVLTTKFSDCTSMDVYNLAGVDIIASATHLPFRDNSYDTVTCVDALEHFSRKERNLALEEIKRVTRLRAIVHTPIDDGRRFLGRRYDIMFQSWHKEAKGCEEKNTSEHIKNIEPSPMELEMHDFKLNETHNAALWLTYMRLQHMPTAFPISLISAWMYYLLNKKKDKQPPFWGALCIFNKNVLESNS